MAHNLARWTARIGLGEQIVTTKTLRRRFFCPGRTDHPLGTPVDPASSPALALGSSSSAAPWPGCEPFHSQPDGARPPTDPPANRTRSPQTRASPVRESSLLRILSPSRASQPPQAAIGPQRAAMKTVRRPWVLPKWSPAISPVAPSPPFRFPHAVHRCPSVDSG